MQHKDMFVKHDDGALLDIFILSFPPITASHVHGDNKETLFARKAKPCRDKPHMVGACATPLILSQLRSATSAARKHQTVILRLALPVSL